MKFGFSFARPNCDIFQLIVYVPNVVFRLTVESDHEQITHGFPLVIFMLGFKLWKMCQNSQLFSSLCYTEVGHLSVQTIRVVFVHLMLHSLK